jgi:hypothetical protein
MFGHLFRVGNGDALAGLTAEPPKMERTLWNQYYKTEREKFGQIWDLGQN